MLNEAEQKKAWEGQFMSEVRALYFAELAAERYRFQQLLTGLTLLFSSSAAGVVVLRDASLINPMAAPILFLLVAVVSVLSQNRRLAIDASDLHSKWNKLALDFARLWEDMYSGGARESLWALEDKAAEYSKSGIPVAPFDSQRMNKWQSHVEMLHCCIIPALKP